MDNRALLKAYTEKLSRFKVVSFDVFDTLIHRSVYRPTDVFAVIAAQLRHSEFGLLYPDIAHNFAVKRIEAESEARARLMAINDTYEVRLDEIYAVLSEHLQLTEAQCHYLQNLELERELQLCHPNPVMQALFPLAGQNGRQIVLCSDMYLPSAFIEKLLTQCGYAKPYTLLVSGEQRKSKHEGSLFTEVQYRFSVQPHDVIHFGDNPHSDVRMAQQTGVKPELFDYLLHRIEPQLRMPVAYIEKDNPIHALTVGGIRQRLMMQSSDFWEDIGLQVFGPLFLGKILWITQLARQNRIERMLFFARDAYLLHQIFARYSALLPGIELKYCYFSRAALLLPSFVDMPISRIFNLYSGLSTRPVSYHLNRLGIDPRLYAQQIKQAGFSSIDEAAPNADPRMFNLLNSLWHHILLEAKKQRPLPLRYVSDLASGATRLGIVDIGWTGNMQGGFSRLLQLARTDYHISGFYVSIFNTLSSGELPRNAFHGYLTNNSAPHDRHLSLMNGGIELLEFAFMAPHGTTLGYREIDGRVQPILEENKTDQAIQTLAARVQKGALDFIDTVLPQILDLGIDSFVSTHWADPFFRLLNDPTLEEATLLGELTHSDAPTDTSKRLSIAGKLPDHIVQKRGKEYHEARQRAYWKKAFDLRNA